MNRKKRIGRRGGARAVGSAAGRNPITLLIPCHRGVRAVAGVSGYRWGVARKQALLALERAVQESGHEAVRG